MPDLTGADPATSGAYGAPGALAAADAGGRLRPCSSPLAIFSECPLCGGALAPEHAHFRCQACGWRDSCCD